MKNLLTATLLILMTFAAPVFAGSGHGHSHDPITEQTATQMATTKLEALVSAGKLDKTWSGIAVKRVEKKALPKGPEWLVTFVNDTVADESKRTLYMFFALDGHFLAANFSGK